MSTTLLQPVSATQDPVHGHHAVHRAIRLEPIIRPRGIEWRGGVDGRPLLLRLTLENPHAEPTVPTPAVLRVADFGAFRPWTPVRTLEVPPVPAGGRVTLTLDLESAQAREPMSPLDRTEIHRQHRRALRRVLRRVTGSSGSEDVAGRKLEVQRDRRQSWLSTRVAAMLPGFEQERSAGTPMHFVGNFDLEVGGQHPVERHCGDLAGLQSNRVNVTNFKVGDGRPDTYTFRVAECEPGWKVELVHEERKDLHEGASLEIDWSPVQVVITPPSGTASGAVKVAVHRASIDQEALVEFKLAAAPSA